MNEEAKIQLSQREMELVNNTDWIFTKQLIIKKVYLLLGQLHKEYKKKIGKEKHLLPAHLSIPGGKISKGENYKGLPYVILDYPASFSKEKIVAVRTLFWWGNFFSIALHISGESFKENILSDEAIEFLKERKFSICINENQWEHDFHPSNFVSINEMNDTRVNKLGEKNFLKIAKKTELTEWNSAGKFLEETFEEIIDFIKISFPAGEKDL
jgi:hypothetical protein